MIVVDSSAVVDGLSAVDGTDELRARMMAEDLHAPMVLDFEVVSALRGLTLACRLTPTRAEDLLADLEDLPLHRWAPADPLRRRAFALRDDLSSYDASYVALAEALDCPLLTRDARLARSAGHAAKIEVH